MWSAIRIPSQRQRVDEHVESSYVAGAIPGDPGDMPKLEAKFSHTELYSPSPSDQYHSDGDDDDCIDFLASLDISNEANVMCRVVVSESECS